MINLFSPRHHGQVKIMKKILLAAIIALAGASFVSCSKESEADKRHNQEQTYKNNLIGKWQVIAEKSSGNVYNLQYRLEGDYYITFKSDGSIETQGSAKTYGYYEGGSEFITEDVNDYLGCVKWSLYYSEVTGADLYLYRTQNSSSSLHHVDFRTDGTIWVWFSGMSYRYYVLEKVQ